jgi:hypothetical protein
LDASLTALARIPLKVIEEGFAAMTLWKNVAGLSPPLLFACEDSGETITPLTRKSMLCVAELVL